MAIGIDCIVLFVALTRRIPSKICVLFCFVRIKSVLFKLLRAFDRTNLNKAEWFEPMTLFKSVVYSNRERPPVLRSVQTNERRELTAFG